MVMRVSPDALRDAFVAACKTELRALKPGNVHVHAGGHGMTVDDFRASAVAAAEPLCRSGLSVGARIEAAITATRATVFCNTNLGIVLLAAPLVVAAERAEPGGVRGALSATLAQLTVSDASVADKRQRVKALLDFDLSVKRRGINPGSSADLTVASLLVRGIEPIVDGKQARRDGVNA